MFDPFKRKQKEQIISDIAKNNSLRADAAARSAKRLRDLLRKDGVTLQILVATGGGKRK